MPGRKIPSQTLGSEKPGFLIRPLLQTIQRRTREDIPHRHKFQEIIYIRTGTGRHFIDDAVLELKAHSFYFINMNQVHGFEYGRDLDGFLIRFSEDFLPMSYGSADILRDYSNNITLIDELTLSIEDSQAYEVLMQLILDTWNTNSASRMQGVRHLLLALLSKLSDEILDHLNSQTLPDKDMDKQLFHRFNLLANKHFTSEHNLDFYAREMGISKRKLSRICQRFAGKTAKALIIDKLIAEINRHLKFTNLSLKEIAFSLSFEDPAYLSRLYSRRTGRTMTQYRKAHK